MIVPKIIIWQIRKRFILSDLKDEYFIVQSNKECERSISYSELIGYTPKISVEPTEGAMLSSLVANRSWNCNNSKYSNNKYE